MNLFLSSMVHRCKVFISVRFIGLHLRLREGRNCYAVIFPLQFSLSLYFHTVCIIFKKSLSLLFANRKHSNATEDWIFFPFRLGKFVSVSKILSQNTLHSLRSNFSLFSKFSHGSTGDLKSLCWIYVVTQLRELQRVLNFDVSKINQQKFHNLLIFNEVSLWNVQTNQLRKI
jgi:hypothetical protein